MKQRLDELLLHKGLADSRTKAQALIMAGRVSVDGKRRDKAGWAVAEDAEVAVSPGPQYVSRGALKLASAAPKFKLDFRGKVVLDVGASTGGFTDYALQQGARRVFAVDVGTGQLDGTLRGDERVVVMEKTDIRSLERLPEPADMAVIDVSFISMRAVLPATARLIKPSGIVVAMVKPQFEAGVKAASKHRGVIKNDQLRRRILKDFEAWAKERFLILDKADSAVAGAKGNVERFYVLTSFKKY